MNDTYFFLPKEKEPRLTTVYSPKEGQALTAAPQEGTMDSQGKHYTSGPRKSFSGGAGLLSTAKDYYLFLQMLANGGELVSFIGGVVVRLTATDPIAAKLQATER